METIEENLGVMCMDVAMTEDLKKNKSLSHEFRKKTTQHSLRSPVSIK